MPKNHLSIAARTKQVASNANLPQRFTDAEAAVMAQPHAPKCFLVCCIDSRFQPDKALDYGPGIALEYRQIAAVIPPEEQASPDFLGRMAFRRLNGIDHILLISHSDCGGAQAALRVPHPDPSNGDDLHAVAAVVHRAGLDLASIGACLLAEEKDDIRAAGDRLSRLLGLAARENLMKYKGRDGHATIADEVASGKLKVLLLHYDLGKRQFELYDDKKGVWKPKANASAIRLGASVPRGCTAGASK